MHELTTGEFCAEMEREQHLQAIWDGSPLGAMQHLVDDHGDRWVPAKDSPWQTPWQYHRHLHEAVKEKL